MQTTQTLHHNLSNAQFKKVYQNWLRATPTDSLTSLVHYINLQANKGYHAAIIGTPDWHYRQIPAYSNSRLTEIRNQLMGRKEIKPARAFVFGTAFHEHVLEPQQAPALEAYMLYPSEIKILSQMLEAAHQHPLIKFAAQCPFKEKVCRWTDPTTRLRCKAKIDAMVEKSCLLELKTTAAISQEAFEETVRKYEYDRQVTFYMDGAKIPEGIIIGVQKQAPFQIFEVIITRKDNIAKNARQRYQKLLQKAKENQIAYF